MKVSVYIATSLDGYIARENGSLDWLPGSDGEDTIEDCGYHQFINSVDVLVMGSNTYEKVLAFEQWPYENKRVIVLSSKGVNIPEHLASTVISTSRPVLELAKELKASNTEHVYVDGGKVIQSFLSAGLVHEMIMTRVPILIGRGIALFGALQEDIKLRHIQTYIYDNGLVQTKYQVIQ